MASRHFKPIVKLLLGIAALASVVPANADPLAVIGILQGSAILVRQTNRFALVEGAVLNDGDIVETPAGAFAQIEFDDGTIVGLGEASRVILKPKLIGLKTVVVPRLYLLDGWVKATPTKGELGLLSPRFELGMESGAVVTRLDAKAYGVFAERGSARLVQRDGTRATIALRPGEFATLPSGGERAAVTPRMSPEYLQQLPKMFRDAFPPRAALYAKRNPALKSLGAIEYADVKPWLQSESGIRLALSRQWLSRASDKAFRAELVANLNLHKEWERTLFPERFLPKKPPPAPLPPRAVAPAEAASAASSP